MRWFIIVFIASSICYQVSNAVDCDSKQTDPESLVKRAKLCENYDKSAKPTINGTTITVKMVLKSFDYTEDGILKINAWMVMSWNDKRLQWNPRDYSDLKQFYEANTGIWTPDLSLYNADIANSANSCKDSTCIVGNKGTVICIPPCDFNSHCDADYTAWPFDRQNCTMMFGAWINTGEELNFMGGKIKLDKEDTKVNLDWKLISASMKRHHGNYSCCPNQTYPSLQYNFIIERHSASHAAVILVPALIMVTLNLIALMVDPKTTERFILIGCNVFAHFMYIQQLSWYVPSNGDTLPRVIIFFRDSMFMTALLGVVTIAVRHLLAVDSEGPEWLTSMNIALTNASVYKVLLVDSEKVVTTGNQIEKIENEQNDDDGAVLVELKRKQTIPPPNATNWNMFGMFVDRVWLVVYILTYLFLIIRFIPEDYTQLKGLTPPDVDNKNL